MNQNSKTLKITTGAMIIAIFAMLLLLNRQTGAFFEGMFIYILPVPMVVYAARYSFKYGLMVFAGMALFSFLFGSLTTVFYAITAALLGLIMGTCFYYRADMTRTMLLSMGLSALFNVLSSITLASVFGFDLDEDIKQMQDMFNEVLSKANIQPNSSTDKMLQPGFLMQLMIISMVLLGLIEGFLIYQISVIILKKLRYPVGQTMSFRSIYPPKWTGIAALAAYLYGGSAFFNEAGNALNQNIGQTLWVCGYVWLLCFGSIAADLFVKKHISPRPLTAMLVTLLALVAVPQILMILGLLYISFDLHDRLLIQPN